MRSNTTGVKGITAYRHKAKGKWIAPVKGLQVSTAWKHKRHYKKFPYADYGSHATTLSAAVAWLRRTNARMKKPTTPFRVIGVLRRDGITVYTHRTWGRVAEATMTLEGKRRRKRFRFKVYGEEAIRQAKEQRRKWERELVGWGR